MNKSKDRAELLDQINTEGAELATELFRDLQSHAGVALLTFATIGCAGRDIPKEQPPEDYPPRQSFYCGTQDYSKYRSRVPRGELSESQKEALKKFWEEPRRTEREGSEWLKVNAPGLLHDSPIVWNRAALYVRPPDVEGKYGLELIDTNSQEILQEVRPTWEGIQKPEQLMVTPRGEKIFVAGVGEGGGGRVIACYEGVECNGSDKRLSLDLLWSAQLPNGAGQVFSIVLSESVSTLFVQVESPADESAAVVYTIHWPPTEGEQWAEKRFLHCGYLEGEQWAEKRFLHCGYLLRWFDDELRRLHFWNYSDTGKTLAYVPFE